MVNKQLIVVGVIIFLGLLFHLKHLNEFPSYIHAWAQSDRYALSLGYVKNNLQFFKPRTFVMNRQFPFDWKIQTDNTITAVDFPIHDYIPAVFMKISGVTSVWIFRLYILLYSFVGLYFLFKLSYLKTKDNIKSIFVVIFAGTSPVFVYYQDGFLPTIPSLANVIIGIYFYQKYLKRHEQNNFYLSILFLTLATLSRTTFAVTLVSIFGLEFLSLIGGEKKWRPFFISGAFAGISVISFYFYNDYLRAVYGSLFLNSLLPAANFSDAKEIIKSVYNNWATQYFSIIHYLILFSLIIIASFFILKQKIKNDYMTRSFGLLILLLFIGYSTFAILMLKQFPDHDYYFLDTFFLPIILFLITVLSYIPRLDLKYFKLYGVVIVLVSVPLIINAMNSEAHRRNLNSLDRTASTINSFMGSETFLDSLKIKRDAKVMVIDVYSPNIPLILMNRDGYVILYTNATKKNIQNALGWKYDYIVIPNQFFISEVCSTYPEIVSRIKKIADNGKISIFTLINNKTNRSLTEFLGLENEISVFQRTMTFD